jgi:NAD(P)-dependent dehydrogenase (short-subunit alcohol dehydrogenase family)
VVSALDALRRSLHGRRPGVAVVTGGSAGVGRATALELARRGAPAVAVLARGAERLESTRRELESAGARALALSVDVSDPEGVEAAADRVEGELGPIDVWVNNAMATVFAPMAQISSEEFRRATEVTYFGSVWGTNSALRRMRPRDAGVIVQVGSALAYRGIPLQAPYCGAKHALQGFLESVRTELLHDGSQVRLTMVQLPALNTPQFTWGRAKLPRAPQPVPPIFQPEVAAQAIVWAAEHPQRQLMVGWPTVKAIVGNALLPALADRLLARQGFEAQQTERPLDPGRPDNLFEPAPGDQGAHGPFDAHSRSWSAQLFARTHAPLIAAGVAASTIALATNARLRN